MNFKSSKGDIAVLCHDLTKNYGAGHGLFDLNLEIMRGEIFGFIGPNGAGKTTTIRLLMDLVRPNKGSTTIFGLDSRKDSLAIKKRVGYLPGELPQYPGVSAGHVIGLLAGLRGGVDPARIARLAERFELDLGRRFSDLSHGNKQKVGLIQAFMHQPELLLLDEPTLGLDPLIQREFRHLLQESVADGATVLLSSHVLAEVELLCDRIGLIHLGKLLRVGTMEELRSVRSHRIQAIFRGEFDLNELKKIEGVTDVQIEKNLLSCTVHGSIGPTLKWLAEGDVLELDSRELSLEEVFLVEFGPSSVPLAQSRPNS